jgi:hypothetical protein
VLTILEGLDLERATVNETAERHMNVRVPYTRILGIGKMRLNYAEITWARDRWT